MIEADSPKVVVVQPVVPSYRRGFFESVSAVLGDSFLVYASDLDMGVLTEWEEIEPWRRSLGPIRRLGFGCEWQDGAMSVPIRRGDVVVVSGAPRCLSNLFLIVKARMKGARTIWWGQLWSATSRWHRFILRLGLMRLAHAVLFYTDAEVTTYVKSFGGWDRRPVGALNNGIDVKPIQKHRAPYTAEKRANEILFIGRLTEKADTALLLAALTEESLANATLHIVGDGPYRSILEHWVRDNGLETRVIWHAATIDESVIAQIANRSSVFCYPGSVGLSLVHAMAYGLPAVVHLERAKHMPEIAAFEHGATGAGFQMGDAKSLAQTLATLMANPNARARMSREAQYRADAVYNTDMMAERFLRILEDQR